jgi:hypothetical protein
LPRRQVARAPSKRIQPVAEALEQRPRREKLDAKGSNETEESDAPAWLRVLCFRRARRIPLHGHEPRRHLRHFGRRLPAQDPSNRRNSVFTAAERPFTAVGAENRLSFNVTNQVVAATEDDLSRVHTVPDPYYVTNQFERTTEGKVIQFVNLPADCIIRIYSSSGVLVALLEHHSPEFGGAETWNVLNRNNQVVASGVYFYHIEAGDARRIGRFTVVNYAE